MHCASDAAASRTASSDAVTVQCLRQQHRMSVPTLRAVPSRAVDTRVRRVGAPGLAARKELNLPARSVAMFVAAWATNAARRRRGQQTSSMGSRSVRVAAEAIGRETAAEDERVQARSMGWPEDFREKFDLDEGEEGLLGEGSFGTVRVARRKSTGKRFAVKMIPKNRGKRTQDNWDSYAELLRSEVMLWASVQNSYDTHVVKMHSVHEDDDYVYLLEDMCEGGNLQELLQKRGTLTEKEAAQAISGVLYLLVACHDRSICFGDVKPANFLLDAPYPCRRHMVDPSAPKGDIVVKGVDFGCSQKVLEDRRLRRRTGTPLYMAPEIMFGWYGLEVDIWAAGMMLYQLLGGKLPFFGGKADEFKNGPKFAIVSALMDNELEFDGEAWNGVSMEAKDLISKMLDVDYNSRITARGALQHSWIARYSEHPAILYSKGGIGQTTSNILDFPHSPGEPVGRNTGKDDQKGGKGSS